MAGSDPAIVGIGASAGGVGALRQFFEALPADSGAAFVIVLHLDPDARSEMANILASHTTMPVAQIENSVQLERNHVYVIAPNRRLHIADGKIASLPFDEPRGRRAPIDLFFRSLAEQHGDALAIILTGAGADGALGVKAIKEAGGIVLVQDPREAEYPSMPRSAIAMEVPDFILPLRELAERLVVLLRNREHVYSAPHEDGEEEALRHILANVRVRTGHDFTQYKRATLLRRIARRAQICQKETLADYYSYLRDTAEEAQALFSDFLISVTTFFRDGKAFAALATSVIPRLFEGKGEGDMIRVWVSGCATGEEAYSIGILLLEEAKRRDLRSELQVFGSDLDRGALAIAREGRFPEAIEADLSEDRLRQFFVREGDHYRVRRELRDIVLFAEHSMLRDPPFSRLDLISCRNLLIYLDRDLQEQVCRTFNYGLNPGGFLFLGASESAEQPRGLFRVVDRDARIYEAAGPRGGPEHALPMLLRPHHPSVRDATAPPRAVPHGAVSDAATHRQTLEALAPPSILVNEAHRVLHLSETAGRYMQPAGGPASVEAPDLVRPELRFELRTALYRAFERGEASLSMPIAVQFNGTPRHVELHVKPSVALGTARAALVMFIEGEAFAPTYDQNGAAMAEDLSADKRIQQLQEELQLARARLRTGREESEATTEELRAANEELQSINEEYRSTSEELETSKEELQSINEELQTVNNELKLKLESVSRANSDLQNLMAATDVGTLFLDGALRIKRFTPRLSALFNITVSDEGRPITDFTHQLSYDGLAEDARMVLRDLTPVEREVESGDGGWYLVRVRPYRTIDDKIDGVVATFVDITERRRAETALRDNEEHLQQEMMLVDLSRSPIFVWDFDGGITRWNRGSEQLYGYSAEEAIGQRKEALLKTKIPGSTFAALRQSLVEHGTWRGELQHTTKDGRILTTETEVELVSRDGRRLVFESTRDVTDQHQWEARQRLLLGELSHRVKNTLTAIQSLVRRTLPSSRSLKDFGERFEGRLHALSEAHNLLIDANWIGAELGELARTQLRPFIGRDHRVKIEGPPVKLPPNLATPFGLVLHELATNAAKYGGLSDTKGSVTLGWSLAKGDDGRQKLTAVWQEEGGPAVSAPEDTGFGSALIQRGLPDGEVVHEFLPTGVKCTIEITFDPDKTGA